MDRATAQYKLQIPPSLHCPFCSYQPEGPYDHARHVCTHISSPPQLIFNTEPPTSPLTLHTFGIPTRPRIPPTDFDIDKIAHTSGNPVWHNEKQPSARRHSGPIAPVIIIHKPLKHSFGANASLIYYQLGCCAIISTIKAQCGSSETQRGHTWDH